MKRLRKKLHSQSGVSILLALLIFLLCMMVSATVLSAAASNAGKIRSSQTEQQKYLLLSSAIQLIADEIEQAEYIGEYKVYEWEVTTPAVKDSDGNVITPGSTDYFFYVEQVEGSFSCGVRPASSLGDMKGELTDLIPLQRELDEIFSRQFADKGGAAKGYKPLEAPDTAAGPITHTLTVRVNGLLPETAGPEAYAVPNAVTVEVELDHSTHHITLTAWLGDDPAPPDAGQDTMIAEMVVKAGTAPVIDYAPGGRDSRSPASEDDSTSRKTSPMQWELNWIKKGTL